MSTVTTAVSAYCDQNRKELLARTVAGANTFATSYVEFIQNIKPGASVQRKFFGTVPGYVIDPTCDFTPSGTTTFTEKLLATRLVQAEDHWCATDLMAKLAQYLPAGANTNEEFDIPVEVIDDLLAQIQRDVAVTAWQGKRITPSTNAMNANVAGWLFRLINNGASSYSGSTFKPSSIYTALTSANIIAAVDDWATQIPAPLQTKNLEIRAGYDFVNTLRTAYRNTYGAGSLDVVPNATEGFRLLGYDNIIVRRDDGLAGAKCAVMSIADAGNFIYNVDLSSDVASIKVGYDFKSDKTIYRIKYAMGTEIKFESEVGLLNYNTAASGLANS